MEIKAPEDKPTTQDIWMRGLFMLLFIIAFLGGPDALEPPCDSAIPLAPVCPRAQSILGAVRQFAIDLVL